MPVNTISHTVNSTVRFLTTCVLYFAKTLYTCAFIAILTYIRTYERIIHICKYLHTYMLTYVRMYSINASNWIAKNTHNLHSILSTVETG